MFRKKSRPLTNLVDENFETMIGQKLESLTPKAVWDIWQDEQKLPKRYVEGGRHDLVGIHPKRTAKFANRTEEIVEPLGDAKTIQEALKVILDNTDWGNDKHSLRYLTLKAVFQLEDRYDDSAPEVVAKVHELCSPKANFVLNKRNKS